ncbi:hypothetical protein [Streptomyces sp. NPDC056883]|uniref:hypothetical protein n=1 Tax=Streptomyces sp. NPDC056883 TaxID=3345959 RepID=UPI0036777D6C
MLVSLDGWFEVRHAHDGFGQAAQASGGEVPACAALSFSGVEEVLRAQLPGPPGHGLGQGALLVLPPVGGWLRRGLRRVV